MREARVNEGAIPLLCEGRHSCQLCDKLPLVPHHRVHLCLRAAADIGATGFPSLYCSTIAGCGRHNASALPEVDGRINDEDGGADMRKSRWRKIATPFGSRVGGDACWAEAIDCIRKFENALDLLLIDTLSEHITLL